MREFFKGWRRKAGCVTLVVAILLAAPWLRSYRFSDRIEFMTRTRSHHLDSIGGRLIWGAANPDLVEKPWTWTWRALEANANSAAPPQWYSTVYPPDRWKIRRWEFNYWYIAIPLTFLSAYLLLWKPRPKVERDA